MTEPLDLDALDEQHYDDSPDTGGGGFCVSCEVPWPCPTSTLIRRVRELEARLDRVRTQPGPTYPLVPPSGKTDVTRLDSPADTVVGAA